MKTSFSLAKLGAAALLLASLTSCEDVLEEYFPKQPDTPGFALDIPFYALSGGTKLDAYSTKSPSTRTASVTITGLQGGEKILAIDFRPATGQLYGLGSTSRVYVINQRTGAARAIGAGAFTPALAGNLVGFDFNPTVDRIRLVTSTGQNLRLNPETGAGAIVDGNINGVSGASITGAAYTNSVAGAATTVLYDLDPATNKLYRQDPPNAGTLVAVGDLKLDISGNGGFDIDAKTGTALGLFDVNGRPTLFTVNLSTGATQTLVKFDKNSGYTGIAIPTQPVAYAVATRSASARDNFNSLLIFDPTNTSVLVNKPITGLTSLERIVGLDFRPANGQLYAISDFNRLFTINTASGAATLVASGIPLGQDGTYGFDFNPVVDRIRIVGFRGQNLRVNPVDGTTIVDGNLNPGTPAVTAAAYENNFAGATATNLYVIGRDDINASTNAAKLFRQSPPNDGTLVAIGELGIEQFANADFDIGSTSNTAYAIINNAGPNFGLRLYTINLSTGKATATGDFNLLASGLASYAVDGFTVGLGF